MWTIPFLLCAALVVVSAWHVRGTFLSLRGPSAPADLPARNLSLYDAAYLRGGASHAAVTALAAMRLEGRLILSRSGTVTVTDATPRNAVEAAVVDAAGSTRQRALRDLSRGVRAAKALHAIGARLIDEGLIPRSSGPHPLRRLAKSRALHGWTLVAACVVGVVTVPLATATGTGGVPSLLAFLLLLALGAVPMIRYRDPAPDRAGKAGRERLVSLRGDASWQPCDVGLDAGTTAALKPFALGSTDRVPGLAEDEVRALLDAFRTDPRSGRRPAPAASATAVGVGLASAGYVGGMNTPAGGSDGGGTGGGHDGGHSGCGGCGGGCGGCGCGG
ncbi:TIGR04222 domain-containing membrane protein [Streptomyces albireticuli]|uniref:TIGR04222 domain-containing membrane protein n=1 Tax=Streptomyces albireticuli TaxID=1940 RepID=UPI0036CDC4A1